LKKIIIAVIAVVVLGGGAAGGYFYAKSKKEDAKEQQKLEKKKENWNPYASEKMHHKSLNEFLISAVDGNYVVKMNVTLDLKDEEAAHKYDGLAEAPLEGAEAAGHGGGTEEVHATPMQTFITSKVGTFMLEVDEKTLHDKEKLEEDMRKYLNQELHLDEDFIKHLYIENFIIQ